MNTELKKHVYEAPRAEIIFLETQNVLCASGMQGSSSTEPISIEIFDLS